MKGGPLGPPRRKGTGGAKAPPYAPPYKHFDVLPWFEPCTNFICKKRMSALSRQGAIFFFAAAVALFPAQGCRDKRAEAPEDPRTGRGTAKDLVALAAELPEGKPFPLDAGTAEKFVLLSLECVDRQYPNKPGDVIEKDDDVKPPRAMHPSFHGCFDWHSAVHGHWAMVKILKTFPSIAGSALIREKLTRHLGRENIAMEAEYFKRPASALFERPYGWGWFLRLAAEIRGFDDPDAKILEKNLAPLEEIIVKNIFDYLFKLSVPVRAGTHNNTAFALVHTYDYAASVEDDKLLLLLKKKAEAYYLGDKQCPADYEPSGEDFISPCLAEADFMRRALPPGEFQEWFDGFLPVSSTALWRAVVRPPEILDKKDPKIGHLIGLDFHKAWAMNGIAAALDDKDPRKNLLLKSALLHENEGITQMFESGYGGEHWLASFAIYLLTGTGTN